MTKRNNLGITIRMGANVDSVTVTDRRIGQTVEFDRAALALKDRRDGLKPWNGAVAALNAATADAWAEDHGFRKDRRAAKLARDKASKRRHQED